MKKFIVSGICTTVVCFLLSSFAPNNNNVVGASGISAGINAPYQDTTSHKKMKKTDKMKSDTTKMKHKDKKPTQ